MLNEGQRLVTPDQVKNQVDWNKSEAVVILCLGKKGESNKLHMSSITINELCMLSKQLDAHLNALMGAMKED